MLSDYSDDDCRVHLTSRSSPCSTAICEIVLYLSQILSFDNHVSNGSRCSPSGKEKSWSPALSNDNGVDLLCSSNTARHCSCRNRGWLSLNVHVRSCTSASHRVVAWCERGAFQSSMFHIMPSTPSGRKTRWISSRAALLANQWKACEHSARV